MTNSSEFTYLLMQIEPGKFANSNLVKGYKDIPVGMVYTNHFLHLAQILNMAMTKNHEKMFEDDFFANEFGLFSMKSLQEWKDSLQKFNQNDDYLNPQPIVSDDKKALKMAYFLIDYFENTSMDELFWISTANMDWKKIKNQGKTVDLKQKFMSKDVHCFDGCGEQMPAKKKMIANMVAEWNLFKDY